MFKANMARPVQVNDPDSVKDEVTGKWNKVPRTRTGKFHVWGFQRSKDHTTGATHMQTVGVVELDNGKCKQFFPENITFLDTEVHYKPKEKAAHESPSQSN